MPPPRGSAIRSITRRIAVPCALIASLAVGCRPSDRGSRDAGGTPPGAADDSMGAAPRDVATIRVDARKDLVENSGATMSVQQAGIVFTINDSGNDPLLFALDVTGADRGAWHVDGATDADWEAISVGRCAPAVAGSAPGAPRPDSVRDSVAAPVTPDAGSCIYIGDVGDNSARRATRSIYRFPEPAARKKGYTGDVIASRLQYVYEDRPHDVEAMYVAPDGAIFLITKRPLSDAERRRRPSLVFELPDSAWRGSQPAVARLVDSLPIVPGSAPMRQVTDAALAPDARRLAVRTYEQIFIFATDPRTGRVVHSVPPATCNVSGLAEEQGEGLAWYGTTTKLLLTSEGRKTPMLVVGCPMPPL